MRINTNTAAMNTYTKYSAAANAKASALEKLSSGSRINTAADDAAGLAISNKMTAQISGMKQARSNAQDGISLLQTAEGALEETQKMLNRMRDLSLQASNGTLQSEDRQEIALEMNTLASNIDAISKNTKFNGLGLFGKDGAASGTAATTTSFQFQVGANSGETTSVTIQSMDSTSLGLATLVKQVGSLAKGTQASFAASFAGTTALGDLDKAIKAVSDQRAQLGAAQNGLSHTVNSLEATTTNLSAANSRIKDVDMAQEMTSYTSSNILLQAATSMLSQANSMPQSVLTLLQNIG
ncbi:flagellin [Ligilactobacillus agilis DSM 20509]|uniref:Flagellin n=5 Tax=Ligilactobacillus agilis TaxID=1601 RepID=A0A0R2A8N1_9LACO|nr:flagellin [Ligilactobacillus agilis]AJA33668.1 flagellin [Ligilactobacillus agilis]KRM62986.1 flagellin [Ligilactobacillus agilis DSM 20509]MBL1055326.1 flagellin [Ligilactobacillus agilis]MBM6763653.1 flagellin [Ligilactobacillus agilis]MBM6772166.1 flagellin [Ligilactobacillus agilis]